jgi:hypothetical protein
VIIPILPGTTISLALLPRRAGRAVLERDLGLLRCRMYTIGGFLFLSLRDVGVWVFSERED